MYMLGWEEAKVLSGYMVSLPIVRKDKWATHFDAVGEWEMSLSCSAADCVEAGLSMPKDVLEKADLEIIPEDILASIQKLATEDFDYEEHIDFLDR